MLASPSTNTSADADPLAFLEPYPDAEAETIDTTDNEDGERDCTSSRALSSATRSCSSSEDSEMMGGRVEKAGPARGDERHGRVYISPLGGGGDRTVRACVRVADV